MPEPKVYNLRKSNPPAGAIAIGRPTIFGNRFTWHEKSSLLTVKVENREEAVKCYDVLLDCKTEEDIRVAFGITDETTIRVLLTQAKQINKELPNLKGKDLVCWCAPLACHGDVLLRRANEL